MSQTVHLHMEKPKWEQLLIKEEMETLEWEVAEVVANSNHTNKTSILQQDPLSSNSNSMNWNNSSSQLAMLVDLSERSKPNSNSNTPLKHSEK